MIRIRYIAYARAIIIALLCIQAVSVGAASDQFIVSQSVTGADTQAPTTPANVVATGVSQTEISLSWDASTDNVAVTGYQVFRDGLQIATSVATSYLDSGLIENTSYDYHIVAFDQAGNFSSSSATTTGTTLALPTTEPSRGGNPPVYAMPHLLDFKIEVSEYAAHLSWRTTLPVRSVVSWGRTGDYEIASLSEERELSYHATRLTNLEPGVEYKFAIVTTLGNDEVVVLREGSFVTVPLPDTEAPPNVRNFEGRIEGWDAMLTWQNPTVSDFAKVRIVSSDERYPRDPYDGTLIYEGNGTTFRDAGVFREDGTRYYALFAYDTRGNESSGAVLRLSKRGDVVDTTPREPEMPESTTTIGFAPLRLEDLMVTQNGIRVFPEGGALPLRGDMPFRISIPYERLPEHLKTILITLTAPEDHNRSFSFLLRVNPEKTAYEAVIDSLGGEGAYPLKLSILNYETQTMTTLEARLDVQTPNDSVHDEEGFLGFLTSYITPKRLWMSAFFLFLFLMILALVLRHGHDKKQARRQGVAYMPLK